MEISNQTNILLINNIYFRNLGFKTGIIEKSIYAELPINTTILMSGGERVHCISLCLGAAHYLEMDLILSFVKFEFCPLLK